MSARPRFLRPLAATAALAALSFLATLSRRDDIALAPPTVASASRAPAAASVSTTPRPSSDEQSRHQAKPARTDLSRLPADTVWTFDNGSGPRTYVLALDELSLPSENKSERIRHVTPQPDLPSLLAAASQVEAEAGVQPRLVLYLPEGPRNEHTRRIVTMRVHVETDDLAALEASAKALGVRAWRTPDFAPGHAVADIEGDPAQPLRAAARLAALPHVKSVEPLLAVLRSKRSLTIPDDPLFPLQWHLRNTGQQSGTPGVDVNVTPIWDTYTGAGVNVGIVDDGLQLTHPDIAPNAAPNGHYDWNGGDTNPEPSATDDHGTAVGGLVAARGNNQIGVSGVAPRATLYGLRLIADLETDYEDGQAESWKNDVIQVKNNSWGPSDTTPWVLEDAGPLWAAAVKNGAETGRGGRGVIYVWAAGNGKQYGDQGSKDPYASNRHVLAVSAITNKGVAASFTESGAHVVTCAPGDATYGVVTTDLVGALGYNSGGTSGELANGNYTQTFGGTSAAAPIVSGVVALMIQANPSLGWRDVKEVLLRTSTQLSPTDPSWVTRAGGNSSAPPIKHHPVFGGGLVNAQAATTLAATWTPLPSSSSVSVSNNQSGQDFPDAGAAVTFPLTLGNSPRLRVEHVELTLNVKHTFRGDLEILLTSPSGTTSTLASPTSSDYGDHYTNYTFTSVRHWGETSSGTWTLSIRDAFRTITGNFVSAKLTVYGVPVTAPTITTQPADQILPTGGTINLAPSITGGFLEYRWTRDGSPLANATGATLTLGNATLANAGTYVCEATNIAGTATTQAARVVLYNPNATTQSVNNGATFSTGTLVAGPADSFQWSRDGTPLANSPKVTGADTRALSVGNLSAADAGVYSLASSLNGTPIPAGAITLTVRPPPGVQAASTQTVRLGAVPALVFTADGAGYSFRYTGLPKGITFDPITGALLGRTTATGSYPVTLTVTAPWGLQSQLPLTLVVDPLPPGLVGTFNGYVRRDPTLNDNQGGAITVTTTAAGQFSGRLTLAATSYTFKGSLDGLPGQPATATVSIPRKGTTPLTLTFTLPLNDGEGTGSVNSTVALSLWRNPWTKANPANAFAARYTFALEPPAPVNSPAGYSTGTVAVTAAGAVSWTLQPADGTAALKGTTTAAADGTWPLCGFAKTPPGSFLGALKLPAASTPSASITGTVSWLRKASTSLAHANAGGFGPLSLTPLGGRYAPPAVGTTLLGLPATTNNVELRFGGTGVDLGASAAKLSPSLVTLTTANKVVLPAANPAALKLTVTPASGLFGGSFTLIDVVNGAAVKRTCKFSGVLLQPEGVGVGAFTVPALPGGTAGTRSGSVQLLEAP